MAEWQNIVNRPPPETWKGAVVSVAKFGLVILLIVWVYSWIQERDREHFEEVKGLKNIVAIQAKNSAVNDINCAPNIELMNPLGSKKK